MAIGLTSRQATVFDAIKALSEGAGIMPTFEELMAATGITSKSAMHDTLCAIEGRGLIRRQKGRARAIEIVEDAHSRAELARQLAAAKQIIRSLTADNEALQRTVAKKVASAEAAIQALRLHQAWSDSEDAGPDYGDQSRDTHPDGERIWRQWWEGNLSLCARAQDETRNALSAWEASK
ncbi:MAG TPA: hypothetical protein PKY73_06385 [Hyphomonas sp.]|nr:hypothetical protein [Hyphomonas sp.]